MKTKSSFFFVSFISAFFIMGANAQKLPNIQQTSIRAPVNIKIDGKATEWDDTFQAHNSAADILYTIANDDENLYLIVQAKDINIINTVVGFGFEFDIQKAGKKNTQDKIVIQYPTVLNKNSPIRFGGKSGLLTDTSAGVANTVMMNNNKVLEQKLKWIIVNGIKGLDTLSIYNDTGIKASGRFNDRMVYTFEIAVPLKYIGLSVGGFSNFAYHMIFNGYSLPDNIVVNYPANASPTAIAEIDQAVADLNVRLSKRNPHTDFWGEYTLAKKQ